jgi:hypothetical protein
MVERPQQPIQDELPNIIDIMRAFGPIETPIIATRQHWQRDQLAPDNRTGGERTNAVVAHNTQIRSDEENVHDPAVTQFMRECIQHILDSQENERLDGMTALVEIIEYACKDSSGDGFNFADLIRVIIVVGRSTICATIGGMSDLELLTRVWYRGTTNPQNSKSAELIKSAVCVALIDCLDESGEIECVNGRCARFLGALTQLDYDERTWAMATYDQHRSDIFRDAQNTINELAIDWKNSEDPIDAEIGTIYLSTESLPMSDPARAREPIFCATALTIIKSRATAYFENKGSSIPYRLQQRILTDLSSLF